MCLLTSNVDIVHTGVGVAGSLSLSNSPQFQLNRQLFHRSQFGLTSIGFPSPFLFLELQAFQL